MTFWFVSFSTLHKFIGFKQFIQATINITYAAVKVAKDLIIGPYAESFQFHPFF
jgi:hypothetical protein